MNSTNFALSSADLPSLLGIASLVLLIGLAISLFFLITKVEELRELRKAFDRIMDSFNELDEQAKLVVKTDLELNKAQEELDRRVVGMSALQKLARRVSMSLNETEIFQRVDLPLATELGFSRVFAATKNGQEQFVCRTSIGLNASRITQINELLFQEKETLAALKSGITFSSMNSSQKSKTLIQKLFDCEHFILSPLLTQGEMCGFIFFGNGHNATEVTQGDEELSAILGNQLAQSLENSRLFEQVYLSSQSLETKVAERTKELSLALRTVEDISRKKSEFVSAVSHELRTPLTSIKGYASILITGKVGAIPDPVKERLAKINTHSDNLVKLINDLLDISRIESGRVEMNTILKPMKPVIDNIADMLLPQLSTRGLSISINVPSDIPEIEIDQTQIDRVFINLISNAVKFTPAGGTISVNAHTNWPREEILFDVADTGIGIKKEDLSRIFDEFFRVDNEINMSVKGTGLGLALAKNIVEAHYGRMWVTSEVNVGTTFHFTLPIKHKPRETRKTKTSESLP